VINIDEMISFLEPKTVWQQPKIAEEVLAWKFLLYFFGGIVKDTQILFYPFVLGVMSTDLLP